MEDISGKESTDWSLYNRFAKSFKPGCSKKQRKRLLSENNIPGVKDDELPVLKAYVKTIDQQLDMVSPVLEELRFQHSISPLIGFTFGMLCIMIMLIAYTI